MGEREAFDSEEAERRWWGDWFEADYSWEGLGRKDREGFPEKPWRGWIVVRRGRFEYCEPGDESGGQRAQRLASLQDYWRADPEDSWRLRSLEELRAAGELTAEAFGDKHWYIAHLPTQLQDGTNHGWKANQIHANWNKLQSIFESRIKCSSETKLNKSGYLLGPDKRAQFDGSIIRNFKLNNNDYHNLHLSLEFVGYIDDSNFSNCNFVSPINFAKSCFFGNAYFQDAVFHRDSYFENTTFMDQVMFNNAKFNGVGRFGGARFSSSTIFDSVEFGHEAIFFGSVFNKTTIFNRSIFLRRAQFEAATFNGAVRFDDAIFKEGAQFERSRFYGAATFFGAQFDKVALFIGAKFTREIRFYGVEFHKRANFSAVEYDGLENDWRGAFNTARFHDFLDFRGSPYKLISMFDGARLEGGIAYPKPGETEALRIFDKEVIAPILAVDPDQRDEALKAVEHGAQVLKHQMRLASDSMREQRFYRFELIARRLQSTTHWSERWSSRVFALLGDYGLSVARPLAALASTAVIFAVAYFSAAAMITDMSLDTLTVSFGAPIHPAIANALELALTNMLGPLRYWGSGYQPYGGEGGPGFRLVIGTLGLIQQLLSLILIFLTALALRRRFQIG